MDVRAPEGERIMSRGLLIGRVLQTRQSLAMRFPFRPHLPPGLSKSMNKVRPFILTSRVPWLWSALDVECHPSVSRAG